MTDKNVQGFKTSSRKKKLKKLLFIIIAIITVLGLVLPFSYSLLSFGN